MNDCISHDGLYDYDDNPLDDQGQPYMPGKRFCGHRDCINPKHLTGYESAPRRTSKAVAQELYPLLLKLGNKKPKYFELCQVPNCGLPYRARNLCNAHLSMLYRLKPEKVRVPFQITEDSFPKDLPYFGKGHGNRKLQPLNCLFAGCHGPARTRGLCSSHYAQYKKKVLNK